MFKAAKNTTEKADKELRRLSREELLELLIASEKKNKDLQTELEAEKGNSAALQDKLNRRELDVSDAGNLADAVMKVNGVYDAASKAAEDYLLNIKKISENQEKLCAERESKSQEDAHRIMKETTRKCEAMEKQTEEDCWNLEQQTKAVCEKAKAQAREEIESYWKELSGRLEEFYQAHEGMKEILSFYNMKLPEAGPQPNLTETEAQNV